MRFTQFGFVLSSVIAFAQSSNAAPTTAIALATPQPQAPAKTTRHLLKTSIDPNAQALLNQATLALKDVRGLHFQVATVFDDSHAKTHVKGTIDFEKPNRLRADFVENAVKYHVISNEKGIYRLLGTTYQQLPTETQTPTAIDALGAALPSHASYYLAEMLGGVSPVESVKKQYERYTPGPSPLTVVTLPRRVVGAKVFSGVKLSCSYVHPQYGERQMEDELWFGPDNLLYQARTKLMAKGKKFVEINETFSGYQRNPTFTASTFSFTPPQVAVLPPEFDPRLKVGVEPFPFTAKSLAGQVFSPAQFKGKVLVLDFWATWCGPCVASLPELEAVYEKYQAQGLKVIGISLDTDKRALQKFVKARNLRWPQLFDGKGPENAVAARYGVTAIPFMLVIGKDGKIAAINPEGRLDAVVKAALAAH